MKLLIIGSGAAGSTAAQFARKADMKAEITVLGDEHYSEYSKCGLPYVFGGIIPDFEELIEFSPAWFQRFKIDLQLKRDVYDIDTEKKIVKARSVQGDDEQEYSYDALIIATGARSWVPEIKGAYDEKGKLKKGVFTLRSMDDAKQIMDWAGKSKRGMIAGSGLVGMEMAEALARMGMDTYVRLRTHMLTGMIDEDMAGIVQKSAEAEGIHFIPRVTVSEIRGGDVMEGVVLKNLDTGEETEYPMDLLIISAGSRARIEVAEKAGCKIGTTGGIVIDKKGQTSVKDIYAAGDCTEYPDIVTGKPCLIGLGSIGVKQGRVASVNAVGGDEEMPRGILNNRTTELFNLEVAAVGPTINELKKAGITPVLGKAKGSTVPPYYPGGKEINVKVMINPEDGKIIAAQIVGEQEVHQRVNVFAIAILQGMTVKDFLQLETCYAPPAAPTFDCMTLAVDAAAMRMRRMKA